MMGVGLALFGLGRIPDVDLEKESIELSFGQRVRAFLLDRVSGREHLKWLRQRVGGRAHRDLALLHRLKQRGLRFWRSSVHLVGEHKVGENGPGQELQSPNGSPVCVGVFLKRVGARDVGRKQIGRELHTSETEIERRRQRADEQRLGEPRHAHEQRMPTSEEGDQHRIDDLGLPHHRGGDSLSKSTRCVSEEGEQLGIGGHSERQGKVHCPVPPVD